MKTFKKTSKNMFLGVFWSIDNENAISFLIGHVGIGRFGTSEASGEAKIEKIFTKHAFKGNLVRELVFFYSFRPPFEWLLLFSCNRCMDDKYVCRNNLGVLITKMTSVFQD